MVYKRVGVQIMVKRGGRWSLWAVRRSKSVAEIDREVRGLNQVADLRRRQRITN